MALAVVGSVEPAVHDRSMSRKAKDSPISPPPRADVARVMDIGPAMRLGHSEVQAGGHDRVTILADVCEALIGAVFIDGGYAAAATLVERFWTARMLEPARPLRDPKTVLQEWAQ